MPPPPLCLLTYAGRQTDFHTFSVDTLAGAARLGFDGFWRRSTLNLCTFEPAMVAETSRRCVEAGLRHVVDVELADFPLDHPAVVQHPQLFVTQRDHGQGIVDPRNAMPTSGEGVARLHSDRAAEALGDTLTEAAVRLMHDGGVGGLHIANADRIHPDLFRIIVEAVHDSNPEAICLASPADSGPSSARGLSEAGVDYLLSSFCRWDGHAPRLFDELDELQSGTQLLLEVAADRTSLTDTVAGRAMLAATLGGGVAAPLAWLDAEPGRAILQQAVETVRRFPSYRGTPLRVSQASAGVAVLLRGNARDLRASDKASLILANLTDQRLTPPARPDLAAAAAQFGHFDFGGELAPYEVRVILVTRRDAIRLKAAPPLAAAMVQQAPRLVIDRVEPAVDDGAFPAKRALGDTVSVAATIFADGHEQLAAELHWRAADAADWTIVPMAQQANDLWTAEFAPTQLGRHEFVVEAWLDRFGGFQRDFRKKVAADVAQPVDRAEGAALVEQASARTHGTLSTKLKKQLKALGTPASDTATELLLSDDLRTLMAEADDRPRRVATRPLPLDAERIEARFSSWYELFPRSMTSDSAGHGTFADVVGHLPRIRAMGFDTLYFPPIHPIGETNRKGPNNTLTPGPDDPGSPYAIGSREGGHDAIHPQLGTVEDFERLVAAAAEHGLEIALDFAIQAAPDHPWLTEHPGWFAWRPDGSMKYAENPPKKYQDIVNVDFYGPDAVPGLWEALRDVVLYWVERGVKVFRVDNPHTKPLPFWEWMIGDVRGRQPDVIFLSEAFTRPAMMYRLAKIGFSQSYTYFTWRERKQELIDYITELTDGPAKDFYRPHFFVNTPDINPFFLQTGGRPAHRIRAALAATLSGLWGVYSGFELCDAAPLGPGKEEYLDSEKYQVRVRDWQAPGNIIEDVTTLNRLRRAHPALQTHLNTRFYQAQDENIIWYGKSLPGGGDALREMIMVMINLDPHNAHACDFEVPLWEFGLSDDAGIAVEDLIEGHRFDWHGKVQHIHLSPDEPYRIWRLFSNGGAQ